MAKYKYWWIAKKSGKLITTGRRANALGDIYDTGCPNLQYQKAGVKKLLRVGEKAVKVLLIQNEED